jgi:hypothetical protein
MTEEQFESVITLLERIAKGFGRLIDGSSGGRNKDKNQGKNLGVVKPDCRAVEQFQQAAPKVSHQQKALLRGAPPQ